MAAKNNPKSSGYLIRKHSHARYAQVNGRLGGTEHVSPGSVSDRLLARYARDQLARKYR